VLIVALSSAGRGGDRQRDGSRMTESAAGAGDCDGEGVTGVVPEVATVSVEDAPVAGSG